MQSVLAEIKDAFKRDEYYYTRHALDQMFRRSISDREIKEAILAGEIIEDYLEDKRGHSCLIYGRTRKNRPLHIQCTVPPKVEIITTYEPHPKEWFNFRERRK